MTKVILFDFFGVFRTDSYKAWLARNNFEYRGGFALASELSDAGRLSDDGFYAIISKEAGRIVTQTEMSEGAAVDFEMVDFARQLKQNYQIALLSNAPSDFVHQILKDNGLNDIFDDIFISAETGFLKPHPEAFDHALTMMNTNKDQVVFIDDNKSNTDSAELLGIKSVHFTSVNQLRAALVGLGVLV